MIITRRKRALAVAVVLLAGALVAGWLWWRSSEHRGAANVLVVYGNVDIRQVQLAFNGSEHVASMLAQEGDRVRDGQLLATLDTDRLEQEVARVAAQVAAQREVVARLEAGSRPEVILRARAEVDAAQADARAARLTYERQQALVGRKLTSQEQVDTAKANAEAAEGRLAAAKQTLELAVAGPRAEDIAEAKATLRAYEAGLSLARRELDDAKLYARGDGIVQDRILEPGDMASPQTPVYTIALTNPVWVRAYLPEPYLGRVAPGMQASVTTDSYPGKRYPGWIGFISPTAEFTPKTVQTPDLRTRLVYRVRVYVCNPEGELRLGMPATVSIPTDQEAPPATTEPGARCGAS
jgi:HlyD family secretion protein